MKNRSFLLSLIFFICISCQSKERVGYEAILTLMDKADVNDFQDLYGFSAESTWRKRDKNGKRRVYRISYSNDRKQSFNIPSFQSFEGNNKEPDDAYYDIEGFASELNYPEEGAEEIAKSYASKLIEIINKYDIKGIKSQKHTGDFIEFIIFTGCSVWYKREGGYLNEGYRKAFESGYQIKPEWYILIIEEDSKALIKKFENAQQKG